MRDGITAIGWSSVNPGSASSGVWSCTCWALGHFPRKKKAAVPVQAQEYPLTPRGLQKTIGPGGMCWHALFRPMRGAGHPATGRITCMILPFFIMWGVEQLYMTLLVKRGRLEVSLPVPVQRKVGKSAPFLRESSSIRCVEIPALSTSPKVAKSPRFQRTARKHPSEPTCGENAPRTLSIDATLLG